ncbi:MAG TPA: hypothetical protein VFS19_01250, partial [Planctomycetota bacterium]|nr:hypothetical protein [Planctomycetota bacterium]
RTAAADALRETAGFWPVAERELSWFESTLSGESTIMQKLHAVSVFSPDRLRKDAGARRYGDRLAQILIDSFPYGGGLARTSWIQAIHNTGSPAGSAFLATLRTDTDKERELISYFAAK